MALPAAKLPNHLPVRLGTCWAPGGKKRWGAGVCLVRS